MAVYLWKSPVDFPGWADCEYDDEASADKYSMMGGVPPQPGERFVFRCDVTRQRIASWENIRNSSAHPLVNQRLANILREHAAQCVELFEPEIECSDGMLEGYSLVLVKHLIHCVNLEQSEPLLLSDGSTIRGYRSVGSGAKDEDFRVKYDEEKLTGFPLTRDASSASYILASGPLADALAAESFKGLRLVDVTASGA